LVVFETGNKNLSLKNADSGRVFDDESTEFKAIFSHKNDKIEAKLVYLWVYSTNKWYRNKYSF